MKAISYTSVPKFEQEFKKLSKKYKTLYEDLSLAKRAAIELFHLQKIDNQSVFSIPNFCTDKVVIYKLKKFACRALKGRGVKSGVRIIYAFFPFECKIEFIEIYFKGDKENEDRERIKMYLQNI